MTKLTIGVGEDFPVDERQAEDAGCRHRGRGHYGHHHHHHDHGHHAGWHHWVHEYLSRRRKKKEEKNKDGES